MIEAERCVECGIAVPRTFGIEKDRTVRPQENVLRTDVAVNEGESRLRGAFDERA